jgi:hypothetical protein
MAATITVTITAHLGIDIAKATFDVALLTADGKIKPKRFDNSPAGFCRLETWLKTAVRHRARLRCTRVWRPPLGTARPWPATCTSVATVLAW